MIVLVLILSLAATVGGFFFGLGFYLAKRLVEKAK